MNRPRRTKSSRKVRKSHQAEYLLEELANLDEHDMRRFKTIFDKPPTFCGRYSNEKILRWRDELRVLWEMQGRTGTLPGLDRRLPTHSFGPYALDLEKELKNTTGVHPEKTICDRWLNADRNGFEVRWTSQARSIFARPSSLPTVMAWTCVHLADRLKFCGNDCSTPYFLAKRKDQKYCSEKCAAPAKREAKLRWWHENRSVKKMTRSKGD